MSALERELARWRLEGLRALWLEGTLRLLPLPTALLLCAACADALFGLPAGLRALCAAVCACALAAGLHRFHWLPLRELRPAALLRRAEERHPEVRARLRPAWELARAGALPGTSQALADEHVRRVEELVRSLPRERLFPRRPSKRAAAGGAAAAFLWAAALAGLGTRPFARVLAPWEGARLERELEIRPGDARVPWGASAEISARWKTPRPGAPELRVRSAGGRWMPAAWDLEDGRSVYRVAALTSPLEYRLQHRGAASAVYLLTPLPYPRLKGLTASVQPPAGRRQQVSLEGETSLRALRGSWVTVAGTADRPLVSAELELSFLGGRVPMRSLGGGRWEGGFPLKESGTLRLRLRDAEGMSEGEPAPFALSALDDLPPTVELLSPAFDVEMSPAERLPVAYEARDDHGLSGVGLAWRAEGGAAGRLPFRRLPDEPARMMGDILWDLSGFAPGAFVEFWVEAQDNAGRPQLSASRHARLRIVDFESAHARAAAGLKGAERALGELASRERAAARTLRSVEGASPQERAAALESWRGEEAALPAAWREAQTALEALADDARQDPYANPGLSEAAQGAAEALGELRSGELARAQEAARAGRFPESSAVHERLAARLERAQRALREGRQMQALQDFWVGAHRADQAGRELGEELDRLAARKGTPSAEERRALDSALAGLRRQMEELQKTLASMPQADAAALADRERRVVAVPLKSAQHALDAVQEALSRGDYVGAARAARRLSEELSRVRAALSEAARSQAESSEAPAENRRLEEAAELWKDAVEKQARALQMTQGLEDKRLSALRSAQQELLSLLAREQREAADEAERIGAPVPPETGEWMRRILKEFEGGQVAEAPTLLDKAARRLRAQAATLARAPQGPPPSAAALDALAVREESIRERLSAGPGEPRLGEGELSERMAASAVQGKASRRTEELSAGLEALSKDGLEPPKGAAEAVAGARAQQAAAEGNLGRGSTGPAQKNQEKALELLEDGLKSLSEDLSRRRQAAGSALSPFQGPRAVARRAGGSRGRSGVDTGFVPLPGSEEYQPPRELRQEVERSLRERRPGAFDAIIREYLKSLSQ